MGWIVLGWVGDGVVCVSSVSRYYLDGIGSLV